MPPHITLVFGVANDHLQELAGLMETASRQSKEVPVVFDKHVIEYDPYEKKHKIFLLCGDGTEKITALHKQLYNGKHRSEFSSTHAFTPHMTIASYSGRSDVEQVNVSAVGELPIAGKLSALQLVRFENDRLTTLKTVAFIG